MNVKAELQKALEHARQLSKAADSLFVEILAIKGYMNSSEVCTEENCDCCDKCVGS